MDNATLTLVKQVAQMYSAKHQPGRHNQQAHDPTKGQHAQTSPGARLLELMPNVPEGATWKQKMRACEKSGLKAAYDNDPELRELVDDICGYTQGSFEPIRNAGNALAEGNAIGWQAKEKAARDTQFQNELHEYRERILRGEVELDYDPATTFYSVAIDEALSKVPIPPRFYRDPSDEQVLNIRGGMFEFKRLSGETTKVDSIGTSRALRSAVAINESIRESSPVETPMYRGFFMRQGKMKEFVDNYKVGSTLELGGPTSFTTDEGIAREFAVGKKTAGGATIIPSGKHDSYAILELEPGAKGLNINALSPYKQKEYLTSGQFEVVSIDTSTYINRIVVRQKEVPVQTLPAWAERKE